MTSEEKYKEIINGLRQKAKSNPKMRGFLQKFYAMNAIHNPMLSQGEELKNEWFQVKRSMLNELYQTDEGKEMCGVVDGMMSDDNDRVITTMAIIEGFFPELVSNEYSFFNISEERRRVIGMLLDGTEAVQNCSPELNHAIKDAVKGTIVKRKLLKRNEIELEDFTL